MTLSGAGRRHKPSVIWLTRPVNVYPQTYVRTTADGGIALSHFSVEGAYEQGFTLSRHEARMLARRLVQCLDKT